MSMCQRVMRDKRAEIDRLRAERDRAKGALETALDTLDELGELVQQTEAERDEARGWARRMMRERDELRDKAVAVLTDSRIRVHDVEAFYQEHTWPQNRCQLLSSQMLDGQ